MAILVKVFAAYMSLIYVGHIIKKRQVLQHLKKYRKSSFCMNKIRTRVAETIKLAGLLLKIFQHLQKAGWLTLPVLCM